MSDKPYGLYQCKNCGQIDYQYRLVETQIRSISPSVNAYEEIEYIEQSDFHLDRTRKTKIECCNCNAQGFKYFKRTNKLRLTEAEYKEMKEGDNQNDPNITPKTIHK